MPQRRKTQEAVAYFALAQMARDEGSVPTISELAQRIGIARTCLYRFTTVIALRKQLLQATMSELPRGFKGVDKDNPKASHIEAWCPPSKEDLDH